MIGQKKICDQQQFQKVCDFVGGRITHPFHVFLNILESFISEYIKITMSFISYQVDL